MRFFRIAHPAFHPLHKKQPFMNRSLFALGVIPTRRAAAKTSLFAASFLFFFALLSFQASAQGCESGDCTNGFGTYRFDDGSVYIGFFQNGRQKGQGTFIWSNGDKYEGQWVAGKQDGEALFTFANGTTVSTTWKNGDLLRQGEPDGSIPANNTPAPTKTAAAAPPKQTNTTASTPPKQSTASAPAKTNAYADNEQPTIVITSPQTQRGFSLGTVDEEIIVRGYASDNKGIKAVRVNGANAKLYSPNTARTNFELPVQLIAGSNKVWVEAEDLSGNTVKQEFNVTRQQPGGSPVTQNNSGNTTAATKVAKTPATATNTPKTAPTEDLPTTRASSGTPKGSRFRTALIIGNAHYPDQPLKNTINDADSMATALRKIGWDVMSYSDLTQEQMDEVMTHFTSKLKTKGGAGLFYYAGHGIQFEGNNYLIPVDAKIKKASDVKYKGVNIGELIDRLDDAKNYTNIVILDACRNNPFGSKSRGLKDGGLAPVNAPARSFIAFSTSPGATASDGDGSNGLYTQELLKAMRVKGQQIEDIFKNVRRNVRTQSGNAQVPWETSSLEDKFILNPTDLPTK